VGGSIALDASETSKKITVPMTILVRGDINGIEISADESDVDITDWGYE
jgi:hypothetical protein